MLAVTTSPRGSVAVQLDAGYFCLQGFTPHRRPRRGGFPDDACLDRVPVADNRVVSRRIAVSPDDTTTTTATCTTSCRTPTAELTCPRRVCRTTMLNKPANICKKAAIQRSAAGAGQVQRVLGRVDFTVLFIVGQIVRPAIAHDTDTFLVSSACPHCHLCLSWLFQ
jgi:hypothetical protein